MPFSLVINSAPRADVPVSHVQGPVLQAMFLRLMQQVDPAVSARLHDEPGYRPFTLSPLGVYKEAGFFQGFRLPREQRIVGGSACYLRLTLLEDGLLPVLNRYFLERDAATFVLGETEFVISDVRVADDGDNPWCRFQSYPELIDSAFRQRRNFKLRFLTPTSFSQGKTDLPLPVPRMVFRSYKKRFEKFYEVAFLPDFEDMVDYYVGVSNLKQIRTDVIKTKKVNLIGFTGDVVFTIHAQAPPALVFQLNLLGEYAFYCGTGKKTALGMGQTLLS